MLRHETEEDFLQAFDGTLVPSAHQPQVSYRIRNIIAKGGSAAAFLATRNALDLATPVVLKVVRPTILERREATATLSVMKEAVALGRLNERLPPTPHVVRLVDSGALDIMFGDRAMTLPWLAVEYVHGGAEGTTLEERIRFSVEHTGYAFDPDRAASAIDCIARGLSAVHEVGVLHRDITLRNVLCSGFGENELFKIADFGLAKPSGIEATFGAVSIGTPGYAAPEQMFGENDQVGTWTDVFSMACVVYAVLTGQDYFVGKNDLMKMMAARKPERKVLTASPLLSSELRSRPQDCTAIDQALARASSLAVEGRPQTPGALADMILSHLHTPASRSQPSPRHLESVVASSARSSESEGWIFTECCAPVAGRVVRHAAWDGANRCLIATATGLDYWSGTDWSAVPIRGLPDGRPRFVQRAGQGEWLVVGDDVLLRLATGGATEALRAPSVHEKFAMTDGDFDDLGILVGIGPTGPPVLHAAAGGRWLKPLPASGIAAITAAARVGEEQWLIAGATTDQKGFVALYTPLSWEVRILQTFAASTMLACASQRHRNLAIVAGTEGAAAVVQGDRVTKLELPGSLDFSAAAIDITGRFWLGAAGELWSNTADRWDCLSRGSNRQAPVRSICAEAGLVMSMSADGTIVEGRLQ